MHEDEPLSRRTLLRRSAVVGAAAWVVPAASVVTMTGLTAASASGTPAPGTRAGVLTRTVEDAATTGEQVDPALGTAVRDSAGPAAATGDGVLDEVSTSRPGLAQQ